MQIGSGISCTYATTTVAAATTIDTTTAAAATTSTIATTTTAAAATTTTIATTTAAAAATTTTFAATTAAAAAVGATTVAATAAAGATTTAASKLLPLRQLLLKGTMALDVPSCKAFIQREGAVGAVAAAIANATGVDVKSVGVALNCSRRLTSDGLFARRLEAVNGAYVITIPEGSAIITADSVGSAITRAGSDGLTTKIAAAMTAVGITDIVVKVKSISTPTAASIGSINATTISAATTSSGATTSAAGRSNFAESGAAPGLLIVAAVLAQLL
ncbi:unnamed protein product [Polarella glacialis]|uniref:Uncharacterized protein n=1 Tax=Polarella glacialis TaxID=89957 RepID=A0A813FLL0_POLGL|nr:unnamed protein product [Polarella glacialis]